MLLGLLFSLFVNTLLLLEKIGKFLFLLDFLFSRLSLLVPKLFVVTSFDLEQFVMRALLHDNTMLHSNDDVTISNGGKSVSNHKRGTVL